MRCAATIFVPGCRHLTPQLARGRAGAKAGGQGERGGWERTNEMQTDRFGGERLIRNEPSIN